MFHGCKMFAKLFHLLPQVYFKKFDFEVFSKAVASMTAANYQSYLYTLHCNI